MGLSAYWPIYASLGKIHINFFQIFKISRPSIHKQ
jgi:hypothetical protein